jgi:hypothetical protein
MAAAVRRRDRGGPAAAVVAVREGPGWMLRFDIGGSFTVIPWPAVKASALPWISAIDEAR